MMLPDVLLVRQETSKKSGTFSSMSIGGELVFFVIEPWKNQNRDFASCIPAQVYACEKVLSNRFGYETFNVLDVPGRENIIFHHGNVLKDTEGCLLPGLGIGYPYTGVRGVINSKNAMKKMMKLLEEINRFRLRIVEWF